MKGMAPCSSDALTYSTGLSLSSSIQRSIQREFPPSLVGVRRTAVRLGGLSDLSPIDISPVTYPEDHDITL